MAKKRPVSKNTLYDWLINYIPEPLKSQKNRAKDKKN